MPVSRFFAGTVLAVVLSGLWVSCGDSRRELMGPSGPGGVPTDIVRIEIVGPASIAPGLSAQYSVLQFSLDGSSRPATEVHWYTSQPLLLQVNATGLATAQAPLRGEATLQAQVTSLATNRAVLLATRDVMVVPDDTFRLVGIVMEADATNVPIAGARVEASAAANSSASVDTFATTGPDGRYKLYGVPPDAELRVRKDGYVTTSDRIQLASHGTRDFALQLDGSRLALAGDYTMTVEAASGCTFPEDLRRRTYDAVIAQNGPFLSVSLSGPQFLVDSTGQGNRFSGSVTTEGAVFQMRTFADFYYPTNPPHPDVVELLPDGTLLVVVGSPKVTATPTGLSGHVFGSFTLYRGAKFPSVDYLSNCGAAGMTLTRVTRRQPAS